MGRKDSFSLDRVGSVQSRACTMRPRAKAVSLYFSHSTVLYAVNRVVRKDLPLADGNVRKLIEDASFPNQWPTKETHIQQKVLYKNGLSEEYGVRGTAVG